MTKRQLQQIYYLNREIAMWQKKLSEKENRSYVKAQQITGMPFGTGKTDNTANRAVDIVDVELIIRGKLAEIQVARKEIFDFIASVDDSVLRQIICYHNVDLMNWKDVAYCIGGNNTENSVKKIYSRFLKTL